MLSRIGLFAAFVLCPTPQGTDDPIPPDPLARGVKVADRERFLSGVLEAEALRRRLLSENAEGTILAAHLSATLVRFRDRSATALQGRPGLERFDLDARTIEARLRGTGRHIDARKGFDPFSGLWFGRWDRDQVDHDWSHAVVFDPPQTDPRLGTLKILATQSAWIGDGFGWNVVAAPGDDAGEVILGTVYHVVDRQRDRVRLHRPHVGLDAGPGRLIWITAGEVFFEEVLDLANPERTRYAITGFRYDLVSGRPVPRGEAFQAVYTSRPDDRPAWHTFPIDLGK